MRKALLLHHAGLERGSPQYEELKQERSRVLWDTVERIIPDIRDRTEIELVRFVAQG